MSDVAVLTTAYTIDKNIIHDFFKSLEKQTFKNFDVVIVNDSCDGLEEIISNYSNLNIKIILSRNTIAENRKVGIEYCKNGGYKTIIFSDFDDCLSNNRVECSVKLLKKYPIVVNELIPFHKDTDINLNNKLFSQSLKNSETIDIDFITDKNIFGLTNTAIRTDIINEIYLPDDIIGIDWFLFSSLMIENKIKGYFTTDCLSYYRQYNNNSMGKPSKISKDKIKKMVKSKRNHYKHIFKRYNLMEEQYNNFSKLYEKINDENKLENYYNLISKLKDRDIFWWDNIIFTEEI